MASDEIQHVTPEEDSLSSITVNISCPRGCPRTFANSSALRLHLIQVHHEEHETGVNKSGGSIWYHCPVPKCLYHHNFGNSGKHFMKLKYLKQHYLKVHASRSQVCECGQGFSTSALLARHHRHCGLLLLCSCTRSFTAIETLQTHVRRSGHVIHHATVEALRARRSSLNESRRVGQQPGHSTSQAVWTHHIPLNYHNITGTNKGENLMELLSPSSASSMSAKLTSTTPANICPAPPASSNPHIIQPTHLLAAIALSELGATTIKRLPCVDVGIQTEAEMAKRSRRKSSSPAKCWEPSVGSSTRHSGKRKRTAETQTRLTHRDSKRQQANASPALIGVMPPHANITLDSSNNAALDSQNTTTLDCRNNTILDSRNTTSSSSSSGPESNAENSEDCCAEAGSFGSLSLQVNLPEFMTTHQSSSGTQTSPRGSRLTQAHLHNFPFSFFDRACGEDEPGITSTSVTFTSTQTSDLVSPSSVTITSTQTPNLISPSSVTITSSQTSDLISPSSVTITSTQTPDLISPSSVTFTSTQSADLVSPSSVSMTSTQTNDLESFPPTQLLIEDADEMLGIDSGPTCSRRRPPPLCNIRSSSIETQTDHDVLLSTNADMPEDADEIILTNTETQTDPSSLLAHNEVNSYQDSSSFQSPGSCHVHGSDNVWCTSETQTYEDFSDIEQYMCSTIHTQTPEDSHSELFPELSFTHTQTQTCLDDPPSLVTTHTQTPVHEPHLCD